MEAKLKGLFSGMLVAALLLAAPAWAQDRSGNSRRIPTKTVDVDELDTMPSGLYFGANIGVSRYELDQDALDAFTTSQLDALGFPVEAGESVQDDGSNAFALVAGYRLSKYFAGEATFMDFGSTDYRANLSVDAGLATMNARLKTRALGFSLTGTLPLWRSFDVHARLGRFAVQTELDANARLPDGSVAEVLRTTDSNQILYGIGASNRIGERWTIDVDYQVLQTRDALTGDVRALLLGFQYRL